MNVCQASSVSINVHEFPSTHTNLYITLYHSLSMSINLHHALYISTSLYQSLSTPIDFFQPLSVAFIVYESLAVSQSVSVSTNLYDSPSISVNLLPPSCVPSPRMFPGVGGSGPQALGIRRPLWVSGVRGP